MPKPVRLERLREISRHRVSTDAAIAADPVERPAACPLHKVEWPIPVFTEGEQRLA